MTGLVSANGQRIPLTGVIAKADIKDMSVRVTLEQHYLNPDKTKATGVRYTFPLPEGASVFSVDLVVADVTIKAVVQEKKEAKASFDRAVSSGQTAALVSSTQADEFQCEVGNLDAGATCIVTIKYDQELRMVDDDKRNKSRFVLPMCIAPKFETAYPAMSYASSSAPRMVGTSLTYRLQFTAAIEMPSKIISVASVSDHSVKVSSTGPCQYTVTFGNKDAVMDKDLVLVIEQEHATKPRLALEYDPDRKSYTMALTYTPELASLDAGQNTSAEYEFVVDCSGSMSERVATVTRVMDLLLRSLPNKSRFNVTRFGSTFHSVFTDSKINDDKVKGKLPFEPRWVSPFDKNIASVHDWNGSSPFRADLGGTELLAPLKAIFCKPVVKNFPRQVFILTDGQVSNTDEVAAEVKQSARSTRVFAVGIGKDVSERLIREIAKAGNGESVLITDSEDFGDVLLALLAKAVQPAWTDVKMDWKGLLGTDVQQCPRTPPPMFNGGSYAVYALNVPADAAQAIVKKAGSSTLNVSALINYVRADEEDAGDTKMDRKDGQHERVAQVHLSPNVSTGNVMHRLAARARLAELGDGDGKEGLELALHYGLLSKYTSFVAVRQDSKVEKKQTGVIDVPLAGVPCFARGGEEQSRGSATRGYAGMAMPGSSSGGGTFSFGGGGAGPASYAATGFGGLDRSASRGGPASSGGFSFGGGATSYAAPATATGGGWSASRGGPATTSGGFSFGGGPASSGGFSLGGGGTSASTGSGTMFSFGSGAGAGAGSDSFSFGAAKTITSTEILDGLLKMANSNGTWSAPGGIIKLVGADNQDVLRSAFSSDKSLPQVLLDKRSADPTALATAMAVAIIESMFAQRKATWQMIIAKARAWLTKHFKTNTADATMLKSMLETRAFVFAKTEDDQLL